MTSWDDYGTSFWKDHNKQLMERKRVAMAEAPVRLDAIYDALIESGATGATVRWEGANDEGGIEPDSLEIVNGEKGTVSLAEEWEEEIIDLVEGLMIAHWEGFWNGTGGTGTATINPVARSTTLRHGNYVEHINWEPEVVL